MEATEKIINPPPIVYSFGQPDFNNKYNNNQNRTILNKKISWDNTIDYKEDDFSDILG